MRSPRFTVQIPFQALKAVKYCLFCEGGSHLCGTNDIREDSGPHQIDHLCHLVDVDHAFALKLLRQSGEGAEHPSRHRSIPAW